MTVPSVPPTLSGKRPSKLFKNWMAKMASSADDSDSACCVCGGHRLDSDLFVHRLAYAAKNEMGRP